MAEIKRRELLGAGMALGLGAAATGSLAQSAPPPRQSPGVLTTPVPGSVEMKASVNSHTQPSSVDLNYKPRRINKVIELWEDKQPIYYNGLFSGMGPGVDSYAMGIQKSQTYEDLIDVEFEHGALDFPGLREFMRGLADGGPTKSGHRTPAVYVTLPIIGLSANYAEANTWLFSQALDCGVHGFSICHAQKTEAVKVIMQQGMRYPFERPNLPKLDYRGIRGSSGEFACQVWGVNINQYCRKADLWPYNPEGEIITGVKIEDTYADQEAATTLALPGVGMAEWGPGDHSYWVSGLSIMNDDGTRTANWMRSPEMVKIRTTVRDLCHKNGVHFLNLGTSDPSDPDYVITQIKDGTMVMESPEEAAIIGREYTKRKMPV